jgi:putative membrane protein
MMAAEGTIPAWQPHVEIWLLMAAVVGLGLYTTRVIQPKVVAAGGAPVSRKQKTWFAVGLVFLWLSTDWPVHDISEERLYWVHMLQHSVLTVVVPPAFLLATPVWLARLIIGNGGFRRFLGFWARPIPAIIVYNFLLVLSHWAWVVNNSIELGWVHYGIHVVLVVSSFLVWIPICGPLPEMRVSAPMKMLTVFLMSVIPTIPAAFLTAAEGVIYRGYEDLPRLWGFDPVGDQQLAGVVMKVITGFYLWGIIAVLFFKWALPRKGTTPKYRGKLVTAEGGPAHSQRNVSDAASGIATAQTPSDTQAQDATGAPDSAEVVTSASGAAGSQRDTAASASGS